MFSTLTGTYQQKLETLYFMYNGTTNTIKRLKAQGSITKLAKAQDKLEALVIEIDKYTK